MKLLQFQSHSAIKSVVGQEQPQLGAVDKLERLRETMIKGRELFRDTDSTEFFIVTTPTVMAVIAWLFEEGKRVLGNWVRLCWVGVEFFTTKLNL
ncbi:hypothetical protein L3X38_014018 [Prunus dulcis]|uniref:Uncharacterized protein n=1 Tax=Prunus dulcis TaxID=3755 RepID=A0AAD4WMJ3_PRUDU|nr:hypothetical protein L3X38_014018 [Prunus dulcis]